jgi:hypothetical protein
VKPTQEEIDMELDNDKYAQGGYIPQPPEGMVPVQLTRGCVLMSLASYRALTPGMREKLFADSDVELVFTLDEVREAGHAVLEQLQQEIEGRAEAAFEMASWIKAKLDGIGCGRCNKPTGNNSQGHYWAYCKVTRTIREDHFCCPNDCELGDQ